MTTSSIVPDGETQDQGDGQASASGPSKPGGYSYFVLFLLALVAAFNYMDQLVLSVLVQPIKAELALSDTQVGLLTGLTFALFYATVGIPIARLADSRSRVVILGVCMTLWSIMTAASGLAKNFTHLLLARIGVGVGEAGCVPTSHSLIGDYFPEDRRAFAVGVFQGAGGLGIMFGMMLAGYLADQLGWRAAFFIVGLPGVLVAIIVMLVVREPRRGGMEVRREAKAAAAETIALSEALRRLAGRRSYIHIVLGYSLGMFGFFGLLLWMPTFFIRTHGLTLTEAGVLLGLTTGLGDAIGSVAGGLIARPLCLRDRRWEVIFPALAFAASIPFYLMTFMVPVTWLALVSSFFAGMIAGFGVGPGLGAIQSVAEPRMRAMAVAIMLFAMSLVGKGIGPLAVGMASDFFTPKFGEDRALQFSLILSLVILLWGAAHLWRAGSTFRRDIVS